MSRQTVEQHESLHFSHYCMLVYYKVLYCFKVFHFIVTCQGSQ